MGNSNSLSDSSNPTTRVTESSSDSTGVSSNAGFARTRHTNQNTILSSSHVLRDVHLPRSIDHQSWRETIRGKLNAEHKTNPNLFQEIQTNLDFSLEEFITVLGDPQAFREAFLQPRYDYRAVQSELEQEVRFINDIGLEQSEMQKAFQRMEVRRQAARNLEVKFILTSCLASRSWLVRNTAYLLGFSFGGLHAGLLVDGTLLEWGRGKCGKSLIVPLLDPADLLFAVDIQNQSFWKKFRTMMWTAIDTVTFGLANYVYAHIALWFLGTINEQQLMKIADVCTNFNRYKMYNVIQPNCQTFVRTLCEQLGLSLQFDGEMSRFVDRLVSNGESDFIFHDQTFRTRQQLDEYVMRGNVFRNFSDNDQKLLFAYAHVFNGYRNVEPNNVAWQTSKQAQQFWTNLTESQRWGRQ